MKPPSDHCIWLSFAAFGAFLGFYCMLLLFVSVLGPESPAHHRGPADLWRPLHVYL